MPYSEAYKQRMIQKMTGPHAISATALSRREDPSQATLSRWLVEAGIVAGMANNGTRKPKSSAKSKTKAKAKGTKGKKGPKAKKTKKKSKKGGKGARKRKG